MRAMSNPWDAPDQPARDPALRRISGNALVLLAVWVASGVALAAMEDPPGVVTFVFVFAGWIASVAVHEFCHAFVAFKGGDTTVRDKGYLTFNPLAYGHAATSLIIPLIILALGGIGFPGGAVYLRNDLIRNAQWRSAAALAGPGGTLLVLLFLASVMSVLRLTGISSGELAPGIAMLGFLQATALMLNLLPLPGLDGYGALEPFLPLSVRRMMIPVARVGVYLLLAIVLIAPGVTQQLFDAAFQLTNALGISPALVSVGIDEFRFWR